MKNHSFRKRFTLNCLFVFIGIIFLLSFTNPCSAQEKKDEEAYKTYIKQADNAFAALDYEKALKLYEKANQAKPEYNYPTDKIEEIKKLLEAGVDPKAQASAQARNSNASYKTLIKQADNTLDNNDYGGALLLYDKAYQIKPDYNYASAKINEINLKLNATPDLKLQIFENTMLKAENFYEQKNYQQANSEFQKASLIDPSAQLPKDRLNQISSIYIDTSDMSDFNLALANGDKQLSTSDFDHAIMFYEAALKIHPNAKFVNKKIAEAKNQQLAYDAKSKQLALNVASADKVLQSEKPTDATNPKEMTVPDKTGESQLLSEQKKYNAALASAENSLKSGNYEAALAGFKSASVIKPSENYPQTKITEIEKLLAEKTSRQKAYDIDIKNGDQSLIEKNYDIALSHYSNALLLLADEKYPSQKITEINSILAKQKSDSENYAQAIRMGEKSLAAGNYNLALTSFQDALKIKPSEPYPMEQIAEIKTKVAAQQKLEVKYANALKKGDQFFVDKDYSGATTAYTEASELKKNEKYPQDQIAKINKIFADSRSVNDTYNLAINEGDKLLSVKDYSGAISAFTKATAIKPAEIYPQQRISEIKKIMEEITLSRSSEYNKALEVADKLYNTKVFDQAIDAYQTAAKINPGDAYPEQQIGKIRKYLSDHAILDLYSQSLVISKGNEKIFTFSALDPGSRKNNYILLKARSTGNTAPKVYLNYGKDNTKNGGIVLRNLDKSSIGDFLINISIQDKWFREDNNWISLSVETGEIEITKVQIAAGE